MRRGVPALLLLAMALGCGRDHGDESAEAGQLRHSAAIATDSTVFGDDREGQTPAVLPEVALLERLIDEYEALDVVMDALASPSWENPVRGVAWGGDRHEDREKERLKDLLASEYGERYVARTPQGAAAANSIARLPHAAGRQELENLVAAQHRRVAAVIEAGLPRLRNARVRAVVLKLDRGIREELED